MTTTGLCLCGCKQQTSLAPVTYRKRGWVKGQPVKFIAGHSSGGKGLRPAADRFWENVDRGLPTDCWLWKASRSPSGYGKFWAKGRDHRAHRFAYELTNGPIHPADLVVRHTCDNPPCVNPAHLLLGTSAENQADMVERDRSTKGARNGRALLSPTQVREIRERLLAGATQASLAPEYGVSRQTINVIATRKAWAWLP